MSGLANVLVVVAVVVLIAARQMRPQQIRDARRWWILPVVLLYLGLREPGIIDAHHEAASGVLLAVELLVGLVMGAAWGWTSRVWSEADGSVWSKGTKATAAVWGGGIALRLGLVGTGAVIGVHQGSGALLLGLAVSLLVRAGVLAWRAQSAHPAYAQATAYGDDVPVSTWRDRR
ncbi:DUF1453 domain-containing protein [Streptomyces sp. NPDC091292]|uniref:DUF1453 domain-containing protein n=1 Tax=Streptomyces sp. NPDC091292 TaxID=3365991 RepID=UPI003828B2B7